VKCSEHLSYSPIAARPGVLGLLIVAIISWSFFLGGMLGVVVSSGGGVVGGGIVLAFMSLGILAGPLFGATAMRVEIGDDGIALGFLGWRRFVAFRELASIRVTLIY
jgi:hypothetical protein